MVLLLLALCIIIPIVELTGIVYVGTLIGVLPTVGLLILGVVVGCVLLSFQGRNAWRRFNDALRAGKPPTKEVLDGALIVSGAVLLIVPGFVSDIIGILLLLPPTRSIVRAVILRWVQSNFVVGMGTTAYSGASAMWNRRRGRGDVGAGPAGTDATGIPYDVEGTAVEVERGPGRLEQ